VALPEGDTCHCLTGWRVRARPASDEVDSCAVELSFPRSFQRRRRCGDRSQGAADPRVVVCPFGDESAS
jgi:hypothetical protein